MSSSQQMSVYNCCKIFTDSTPERNFEFYVAKEALTDFNV